MLLVVISAGFTAGGVAILIFDPDERAMGSVVVLFFGSCLLVFLAPLFERRREGRRRAVVSHRGARTEALVFPVSRVKLRIFGLAGALWAVAGALLVVSPGSLTDPGESTAFIRLLGLALIVLFGGVAVLSLFQEVRGGFVALLPEGILARAGLGESFVSWEAIEAVGVVSMYDTPMVAVRAVDPSAVEMPRWARLFARANRALADGDVYYTSLTVPEEEVADAIADRLEHPEKRTRPEEP